MPEKGAHTMPAFEPPQMTYMKDKTWRRTAKPDFRSPEFLWKDCWQRFNTMAVPILDEDAFFADAIAAARIAEDREHLEELLAEKREERRCDLEKALGKIALSSINPQTRHLTTCARDAALKIGQTGSLDSFIQFVSGVVYSWNGGEKEDLLTPALSADDACIAATEVDIPGNGDDASDLGGDPWEHENTFPPELHPPPEWDESVDDSWNYVSKAVTECNDADETSSKHRVRPFSSTGAHLGKSSQEGTEENEKDRSPLESPVDSTSSSSEPPTDHDRSSHLRSPSPESIESTPVDTATTPSKQSQPVTSPSRRHAVSPRTSRISSGFSDVKGVNTPCPLDKLDPPGQRSPRDQSDGHARIGNLATEPGPIRKRTFAEQRDEYEDDGEGRERRKRRSTKIDPLVG